jgi:peptide/nickel transport system permease protein
MLRNLAQQLTQRVWQAAFVGLVVGVLTFAIMRALPGDAAYRIAAARYGYDLVDSAAAEAVRRELALNAHWFSALLQWLADLFTGRLGKSVVSGESVWQMLWPELQASLALAAVVIALAMSVGVPLGIGCALRPKGLLDRVTAAIAVAFKALPPFALGLMLMMIFAVQIAVVPAAGHGDASQIALPAITLALPLAFALARIVRASLVTVLQSPYWAFARAKGLSARVTLLRHGLRNAALPVVTWLGMQAVLLIEGVVIIEALFARPGLGHALVHAIFGRDVPVIQGTALVLGLGFVLFNTFIDLLNIALDPRLRSDAP